MPSLSRKVAWRVGGVALALLVCPGVQANPLLDRRYALENVGILKAWDNVDGLFSEYVLNAYKDFFSKQSRFNLQDLSKADAVLEKSKLPYNKLLDDPQILAQIARSMRSDSVLRTKVYKEGPRYRFSLDWLHPPAMDLLASETFVMEEPRDGTAIGIGDIKPPLHEALARLIKKVPFNANVTGRDRGSITVNIGRDARLQPGDTLVLGTLEEVKRHPLLREVVDWRFAQTGRVEVEEVDDAIAFCRIVQEEPGRQVSKFQKVVQIIPAPEKPVAAQAQVISGEMAPGQPAKPRLGWASGGVWAGSFSRQYSSLDATTGRSGSGFFTGAKADAQLWMNRNVFAELGLEYGFWGYSQTNLAGTGTATSLGSGSSVLGVRFDAGYTYFTSDDLLGPKGWVKLGYKTKSYTLPISETEFTGPSAFKGVFLGVGADLAVRNKFGALLTLDFGFLTSATETGFTSGTVSGASDVSFYVGGYYRINPRTSLRVGLDVMANSAEFTEGVTLNHRIVSFGPSLQYYF